MPPGTLERRELSAALKQLGFDGSSEQTIETMNKFSDDGSGQLSMVQFNRMIQDMNAQAQEVADREVVRQEPYLPLRVSVYKESGGSFGPPVELAYARPEP